MEGTYDGREQVVVGVDQTNFVGWMGVISIWSVLLSL